MRPKRQIRPKPAGTGSSADTDGAAGSSSSWASGTAVNRSSSSSNLRSDGEREWARTLPDVSLTVQGAAAKDRVGTTRGQWRRNMRPAGRLRGARRWCECGRRLAILWGLSATAALSFVASLHSSSPERPSLPLHLLWAQRRVERLPRTNGEAVAESLQDNNYHYEETDDASSLPREAVDEHAVSTAATLATPLAAGGGKNNGSLVSLEPLQCCNYFAPRVEVGQVWCRREMAVESSTPRPRYHTTAASGGQEEAEEVVVRTLWERVETLYQLGRPVRLPLPLPHDVTKEERAEAEARAAAGATREAAEAAHSGRIVGLAQQGGAIAFPSCSPAQSKHVRATISEQALRAQPALRDAVRWRKGDVRYSKRAQTSTVRERRKHEESKQDTADWENGFAVLNS